MKRIIFTFCFTFCLAFPLLADDLKPIEGATPETLLGGAENFKIVTTAKEVAACRVAKGATKDHVTIDGLKCGPSGNISGPEQQKVVAALSDISNFGEQYKCIFDPAIILRFKTDAGTVDIAVCFGCDEMEVYRDGRIVTRPFKLAATENSFGKGARAAFTALAKKAFPDDPEIKALQLPMSTADLINALQNAGESYYDQFHALPETPENYKVVAALLGANADKKVFIELNKNQLSPNGEVLDEWGTPLRFNFTQDTAVPIEAISAGKDQLFGTGDDIPKPQTP